MILNSYIIELDIICYQVSFFPSLILENGSLTLCNRSVDIDCGSQSTDLFPAITEIFILSKLIKNIKTNGQIHYVS